MPIYEYVCNNCGAVTEKIHGMNEKPSVKCADCGGKAKRKVSSSSFVLKGTGWYVTDYGKKSKLPESGPGKPEGKKEAASPRASTRAMPKLNSDPD